MANENYAATLEQRKRELTLLAQIVIEVREIKERIQLQLSRS